MAFNPEQFKPKKKRAVDPNAPPRPNLLTHDKKLRETTEAFGKLYSLVERQAEEIAKLKQNYRSLQQSVEQILNHLRKGR